MAIVLLGIRLGTCLALIDLTNSLTHQVFGRGAAVLDQNLFWDFSLQLLGSTHLGLILVGIIHNSSGMFIHFSQAELCHI